MYSPSLARDPRVLSMPGMLDYLAGSGQEEILVALAENPALSDFPADVVSQIMRSNARERVFAREDIDWGHPTFAPYVSLLPLSQRIRLASRSDLPSPLARLLANDEHEYVRHALAGNPAIIHAPEIAQILAQDQDRYVRDELANNPALPYLPGTIKILAQDTFILFEILLKRGDLPWDEPQLAPYKMLRNANVQEVAQKPWISQYPDIARLLVRHPNQDIRQTIAANPAIANIQGLIEEIAQGEDWASRYGLAQNPALVHFPKAVELLSQDSETIRLALAANPALSHFPTIMRAFAKDVLVVRLSLAKNPEIANFPDIIENLATSKDELIWSGLASNPAIAKFPDIVQAISLHPSSEVRRTLAANPALAQFPEIARRLAQDNERVCGALASSSSIAHFPDAAHSLAQHPSREIRLALASNPAIAHLPEVVHEVARQIFAQDGEIGATLAKNPALPSLPPQIIRALLKSPSVLFSEITGRSDLPWDQEPFAPYAVLRGSWQDHEHLARHTNLQQHPQAVRMLARHPSWRVRQALASSPTVAQYQDVIDTLAQDEDIDVRRVIFNNPNINSYPPKALKRLLSDPKVFFDVSKRDDLPWNLPPLAPYAILQGESPQHKKAAQRPDLHLYPEAARLLANHPNDDIRAALAQNPSIATFPDIPQRLAQDNQFVRFSLAANPALLSLPEKVVSDLLSDAFVFFTKISTRTDLPWEHIWLAPYAILRGRWQDHKLAAQRPDLDKYPQAALLLARHPDNTIRNTLAANPALSKLPRVARSLQQDKNRRPLTKSHSSAARLQIQNRNTTPISP